MMRFASAYQLSPRYAELDSSVDKLELIMNGWGHLPPGNCKVLRVGNVAMAFLTIEQQDSHGAWSPIHYLGEGRFDGSGDDWVKSLSPWQNRLMRVENVQLCIDFDDDFKFRTGLETDLSELCGAGRYPYSYPYLLQHSNDLHFTLSLE
jgi:hypothetical protein